MRVRIVGDAELVGTVSGSVSASAIASSLRSSYAAEPDALVEELRKDEAIAEADTLLLHGPEPARVAYNTHVLEAILTQVAPALGWR